MKKLALFCLCSIAAVSILTGCSKSTDSNEKVNVGTVTLSEYKGVKVNVAAPEVTDEEVDTQVQSALKQNPDFVEVDRAAKDGDTVNIDYKGMMDGVEFAGGSETARDLKLGSGKMIEGFESGLVGAKKGEAKTLNLTFPENYQEETLAGQAVVFEVTVNSVKEEQAAVLDDAFVQRVSPYQTVDEYKQNIHDSLLAQKQQSADQQIQQAVLTDVIDNSTFKLSKNGLSKKYNEALSQYTAQAKMYGMTFAQLAQANSMDEAGMKQYVYASAKSNAKSQLVIDAIAEKEGMSLTDEDKALFAQVNGQTVDSMVSGYGEEGFNSAAMSYKVMQFLAVNAVNEAENPAVPSQPEVTEAETTAEETTAAAETTAEETTAAAETTAEETTAAAETTAEETTAAAETTKAQ